MTKNKIQDTQIGGKYTGGDDHSVNTSVSVDAKALAVLNDIGKLDKFALNAQKHISQVAEKILETHDVNLTSQGLDFHALQEKFSNVKCTEDYIKNFKKASAHFHEIDQIKNSDAVSGGEITIRCIMVLIHQIYSHFFNSCDNGDAIHKSIIGQIIDTDAKAEEIIATDILIFYAVNECGIFNERK